MKKNSKITVKYLRKIEGNRIENLEEEEKHIEKLLQADNMEVYNIMGRNYVFKRLGIRKALELKESWNFPNPATGYMDTDTLKMTDDIFEHMVVYPHDLKLDDFDDTDYSLISAIVGKANEYQYTPLYVEVVAEDEEDEQGKNQASSTEKKE